MAIEPARFNAKIYHTIMKIISQSSSIGYQLVIPSPHPTNAIVRVRKEIPQEIIQTSSEGASTYTFKPQDPSIFFILC